MTFSKAELQPKTGWPEARANRSDDAELSRRSAAILNIYVANPVHRGPFEAMDRLRAQTPGRRGTRQYAIRVTGSSGAGKSTLAKKFVEKVTARGRHADGERRRAVHPQRGGSDIGEDARRGRSAPSGRRGMGSRSRQGVAEAGPGISGPTRSERSGQRSELGRPNAGDITQATAAICHLEVPWCAWPHGLRPV